MSETQLLSEEEMTYQELPLVAAQPGIWIADQIASQHNAYTVAHVIELSGDIVPRLLDAAIRQGLSEADTLHAHFGLNETGEPVQQIPRRIDSQHVHAPEWLDFSKQKDGDNAAWTLFRDDVAADLPADGGAPLYRQVVVQVAAQPARWLWYQRYHHILLDGFSFHRLNQRIVDIYNAHLSGGTLQAAPFTPFAEVVQEYQSWQTSVSCQRAAAFWQEHARDLPAPVSLASDVCVATVPGERALHQRVSAEGVCFDSILSDLNIQQVQPAELVMAALYIYLFRMSGESRLSVGFPFMRRMGSAALSAVGPVVNVLPLSLTLQPDMTIKEVTLALVNEINVVRRHQRYEAEQLRRDLGLVGQRDGLYGPVINFKVYHDRLVLGDTPATVHTLSMGPIDDLEFVLGFDDGVMNLELVANPARYDRQTLQWHAARIHYLLRQLMQHPQQPIGQLALVDADECERLAEWGRGPELATSMVSVLARFSQQVASQPDTIAVACGVQSLSYRELSDRVMQLARFLIGRGIGADDVVAIGVPRSIDTVVAILGVLASGAAYMPLDLDYPRERLTVMCEDAQPVMVLTHRAVAAQMPALSDVICLDDRGVLAECMAQATHSVSDAERRCALRGEHLAYIIYTSGSTGRPKGVMSTHVGLLNLLLSHEQFLFGPAIARFASRHGRRLRAGHTASFSFDSSWEPLFCMMMGSELRIFDETLRRDAWALVQQMNQEPVDLLDITPSFFSQMIDSGLLEIGNHQPTFIMIGGEAATPRLWERMRQQTGIEIHNYYGPSEYTVDTLGASVTSAAQPVLGQPVANTRIWLLDEQLRPVPAGVPGELYIAGEGIARGYLRRPSLTATRFVADPFGSGDVIYRSGDVMRWRSDGLLTFIGRVDHQIKVRGFRVELGEIENALVALPEVSTAVVIAEPLGATNRLIGYCSVPDGSLRESPDISTRLLTSLAAQLPDYMVPALLVVMAELPLTVNGKIDRQALPDPQCGVMRMGREPESEQEKQICQSIAALLRVEQVWADDDFFALGGDSISAMGLGTRMRQHGWLLRPREIFSQRTPANMALAMQPMTLSAPSRHRQDRQGPIDGVPILHWFAQTHGINRRFAHGVLLRVPPALRVEQVEQALSLLVKAHPALAAFTRDRQLVVGEPLPHATEAYCDDCLLGENDSVEHRAEQAFDAAVAHLDPTAGRMVRATLLRHPQRHAVGLVLALHHLVVDGVSWRVLLAEFQSVADALIKGDIPQLAAEEYTLHAWSDTLLAQRAARRAERPFWQRMLQSPVPRLGARVLNAASDRQHQRREMRLLLDARQTDALIARLPQRYRAETEEILLSALMLAGSRCYDVTQWRLSLESHGRADLNDGSDLTRTVGWLTAEYPVNIGWIPDATPAVLQAVRAVKQVLRSVPDRGIGYGILRYLDADSRLELAALEQQHAPEILFNYLGRFTAGDDEWALMRTSHRFRDAFAVALDDDMPLCHALEINIFCDEQASAPRLAINWGWADGIFDAQAITALHQGFVQAVDDLMAFAALEPQRAEETLVAADVGLEGVSDDTLAQLSQHYGALADILPLLPLQQGLLFHAELASNRGSYNSLTRLSLRGSLDVAQLSQALECVVRQHPQLAARFDTRHAPLPLQIVPQLDDNTIYWPLDVHTLPALSESQTMDALLALEHDELARDLFHQPASMLHAVLVRHDDASRCTLFLNAHHLIVDGWSTPVLLRDLFTVLHGGPAALVPLRSRYVDIVRQLVRRDATLSRQRWQHVLDGVRPTVLFDETSQHGAVHECDIRVPPELEQGIMRLCRQHGITLNTVMQGIWGVLLSAYSGFDDVVFGSPVSGRFGQLNDIDRHVGLFSNTLPVRIKFDPAQPLLTQLIQLQAQQILLIEHDDLGLGEIQQLAGIGTLFDTLLVVENYPDSHALSEATDALRCERISNRGYTHYPLTLLVLPGECLRLLLEYREGVPQPQCLVQRLMLLLEQLVTLPEAPLCAWTLQTPQEQALLTRINQTDHPVPSGTLHEAVDAQARRTPESVALVDDMHRLTYRQVRSQTRLLAAQLVAAGVRPGDIVAVALPRSVRLSLALMAILEVGAAWLPLDTGYPDDRLALMVDDAAPRLIITASVLQSRFAPLADVLLLDSLIDERQPLLTELIEVSPQQAAYVIYTSGSTGRPKGVVVSHQAIVNRLWWMQASYTLSCDDVVLQKTPCSFDVSVWEFFWPLMTGACLVMAPPESHRDPDALVQLINDYSVTTLHFVPSMLAAWVNALENRPREHIGCTSLRRVFCSGEALSRDLALSYQALLPAPLHNLYGPTEAAVDVTYQPASGAALANCRTAGVPIGLPVWNTQLRILDSYLRPVPVGVAGDLYLCGVQLAEGYLRRPDLTASRFVADPFAHGERMYHTGDIARWQEEGTVEYLGRSDDQLKIRGQRIELGEIEQALSGLPGVAQAVVCARDLGTSGSGTPRGADARQLVAWVIVEDGVAQESDILHQALAQCLPAHMLPVSYVFMTRFPLSANGKLDRKALPAPVRDQQGRLPESETERLLAACFSALLGRDTVYVDDDFFALGGHSLLAMRLAADIRQHRQPALTVGQIMASRSVEKMAALLDGSGDIDREIGSGTGEILPLRSGRGPALFCLHPASGFAWQYTGLLRYLKGDYPIVGLQSPRPQGTIASCATLDDMCERHLVSIRRLQPQGPYYLLGYSLGGTIAQGIAARLQAAGECVEFLGLLDTYPPEGQDWTGPSEEEARQEVAREQASFMSAAEDETDPQVRAEKAAMFNDIVANYRDAVRLLSAAQTRSYHGEATLFVATRTLPEGMDVQAVWAPYVRSLNVHPLPYEHADIISPASLETLGPLLQRLLTSLD
ncbi:amino acid adenylation domain-containing protein [Pectobacterium parmentieri]|uniref:amino acid adenylation domain-containing protein n=1 Tax=Pectobacterium parmentieri TaxID=1905730 RepID=UPI000473AD80|nr:non-ribosomal peptide synthetase [Pectobacterium parmentieri]PWD61977.1 non-ribosomal peptide synthetase [Pectobacterium parmentieri]